MNFMNMDNDTISLVKPDGTVIEGIKANVQPKIIFIHDEKLPLEEGDKIYRRLPNGLVETYVVLDRGYYSSFAGISGHYQAKVRKDISINEDKYQSIINVYNANGLNSRININSTDNSNNINNDPNLLFDEIKRALEIITERELQEKSLVLLEELRNTQNTPDFLNIYKNFISVLAESYIYYLCFYSCFNTINNRIKDINNRQNEM